MDKYSKRTDYESLYRKANPKVMPYSVHERQRELSDLWPCEQEKFKRMVDAIQGR